MYLLNTS